MRRLVFISGILPCLDASSLNLTNGVPGDIFALTNVLPKSADYGLYSLCELPRGSGQLSGICVPTSYVAANMSFCGSVVKYAACVPPANPVWPAWNVTVKDALIESMFTSMVAERMVKEELSLAKNGSSEEYLQMRFTGNQACIDDFKKIMCYYNFPQCDYQGSSGKASSPVVHFNAVVNGPTVDLSGTVSSTYPMCYERCTEYFSQCHFSALMASEFCQSGSSVWPMLVADEGTLAVSPMVSGSVSNCTGKDGTVIRHGIVSLTVVILISVVITDNL